MEYSQKFCELGTEGALDQADFALVLNQDLSVFRTTQTGLHQPGLHLPGLHQSGHTHLTLSSEECRIINMKRYLRLEPGGTGPA